MAIDESKEHLITLGQATRLLPTVNGKRVHTSTLWRWATKGLHGHRLEAIRQGRRWFTTAGALRRFSRELTVTSLLSPCSAAAEHSNLARLDVHASRYEDVARAAEAALDAEGI